MPKRNPKKEGSVSYSMYARLIQDASFRISKALPYISTKKLLHFESKLQSEVPYVSKGLDMSLFLETIGAMEKSFLLKHRRPMPEKIKKDEVPPEPHRKEAEEDPFQDILMFSRVVLDGEAKKKEDLRETTEYEREYPGVSMCVHMRPGGYQTHCSLFVQSQQEVGLEELEMLWNASKENRLSMKEMNQYTRRLEFYIQCHGHLPPFSTFY